MLRNSEWHYWFAAMELQRWKQNFNQHLKQQQQQTVFVLNR